MVKILRRYESTFVLSYYVVVVLVPLCTEVLPHYVYIRATMICTRTCSSVHVHVQ